MTKVTYPRKVKVTVKLAPRRTFEHKLAYRIDDLGDYIRIKVRDATTFLLNSRIPLGELSEAHMSIEMRGPSSESSKTRAVISHITLADFNWTLDRCK